MLKPCRVCGRPSASAICTNCKAKQEAARPSRQERGYDNHYARARARILASARRAWARGQAPACVICGLRIESESRFTVEHIRPLRLGGTNDPANLGPAHERCNYGRH